MLCDRLNYIIIKYGQLILLYRDLRTPAHHLTLRVCLWNKAINVNFTITSTL